MPPEVVLDTSVLFSPTLRDTLLRCAEVGLYIPLWSQEILDELRRSLIRDANVAERSADRTILAMKGQFPEALIDDYQHLTPRMTNELKDRHVVAAAVHANADIIVTLNLRHFSTPHLVPFAIEAQSPDTLLTAFAASSFATVRTVIEMQAKALTRPPRSIGDILVRLQASVPAFAESMRVRMLADRL